MIQETDLLWIKHWFDGYVHQFYTGDEQFDSAISLKEKHTKNVAIEILDIACSLDFNAEQCYLAEIIALLHDIGRFEQYARYHTYSDRMSEDHAKLGIEVIRKTGVLNRFSTQMQNLIESVVTHHNQATLPQSKDLLFLIMLKLLRDADKIDILQVVTEHYLGFSRNNVINLGLPDSADVSDAIVQCVMNRKIANVKDLKTRNDFKLLQISWIFDLNYHKTYRIFENRRYLDKLSAALPQTDTIVQAIGVARQYLSRNVTEETISECEYLTP